jgi:hypothetical protein
MFFKWVEKRPHVFEIGIKKRTHVFEMGSSIWKTCSFLRHPVYMTPQVIYQELGEERANVKI